jgi:hypothetical protein
MSLTSVLPVETKEGEQACQHSGHKLQRVGALIQFKVPIVLSIFEENLLGSIDLVASGTD